MSHISKVTLPANVCTRRDFLCTIGGTLTAPWLGLAAAQAQVGLDPTERQRIESAIPTRAFVLPVRPRKLLIFDLNVGYGGHGSIPTANLAFTLMGAKTGAFQTVISRDPSVFKPENLKQFDAVFLNNTVGNLFEDPGLRQSLMEFVYRGGGLLGVHGTSVAFTRWPGAVEDWPEFGIMLGARGANHRDSDEHIFIKLDDPNHPLNQPFGGKGFEYRDEFFRVHGPYSRHRVRVLLGIDTDKTDINQGEARGDCVRQDNDYALAWVRQYGRGRVFYCTIAHNPYVFWDPKMLQFYLAAVQFALGDLPAPTIPSGKLTPPIRAQEQLGWHLELTPFTSDNFTLFDAIDKAAELGLLYIGGWNIQTVSRLIPKKFDGQLSDDELKQIRLKLDAAGVRLVTYHIHAMPSDESGCRGVFEFGRKMGIETVIAEPPPDLTDTLERLCDEYDINLAILNRNQTTSPHYERPEEVLKVCRGRSKRISVCGNLASWIRSGISPVEAVRMLGDRLIILQVHDVDELSSKGHDVPWGTGAGKIGPVLEEIHRLSLKGIMFSFECGPDGSGSMAGIAQSIELFNKITVKLPKGAEP
jgi:type 1 glutamine amidotransferase/sugar phosphate isomerase/epimerase